MREFFLANKELGGELHNPLYMMYYMDTGGLCLNIFTLSKGEEKYALGKQPAISNYRCPKGRGWSDDDPR